MSELKIGVAVANFRQPLRQALPAAAQAGVDGVEIDARGELRPETSSQTGLRQFRRLLEDLNLRTSAVSFSTRRGYDVQEDLDRRVAATKAAMQFAYSIGARVLVNHIGRVPADESTPGWQSFVEVLSDLGAHGQHVGVLLAARTGAESGADLARLLAALPDGTLGVDLDPAGLLSGGFSPREVLDTVGQHVVHVHATDAVRDLSLGRGVETPLGRGSVDYPRLLGQLAERNYRGWITLDRRQAPNPAAETEAAAAFLKRAIGF